MKPRSPRASERAISDAEAPDEASFEGLINFSSEPPPEGDVHNASTKVTQLPYTLLESLRTGGGRLPEDLESVVESTVEVVSIEIDTEPPPALIDDEPNVFLEDPADAFTTGKGDELHTAIEEALSLSLIHI